MTLIPTLKNKTLVNDALHLTFLVDQVPVECQSESETDNRLLHTIIVRNAAWGVRAVRPVIAYTLDAQDANACQGRNATSCAGDTKFFEIPLSSIGQVYWKGTEKKVIVRVCVPVASRCADFNLSYSIKTELESRDSLKPARTIVSNSNMHVEVK
jgi:hypothetical protein